VKWKVEGPEILIEQNEEFLLQQMSI